MARGRKIVDRVGQRSGMLTVESFDHLGSQGAVWLCRCDCGNTRACRSDHWARGAYTRCEECKAKDALTRFTRHGHAANRQSTRLYGIWNALRQRCSNPNNQDYRYYGGKGVRVCEEWQVFETFRDWAYAHGYSEGLSIDRVDPNKHYHPDNCEWVTVSENSRRSHVTRRAA
jgi:hypothetical protein